MTPKYISANQVVESIKWNSKETNIEKRSLKHTTPDSDMF